MIKIHHVRFAVKDIRKFSKYITVNLKFKLYAHRKTCGNLTLVFKHGSIIFLVQERKEKTTKNDFTIGQDFLSGNNDYIVDTACDICMVCDDLNSVIGKAVTCEHFKNNPKIKDVHDENGLVSYTVIKSPVGNVQHTFINLSKYTGPFLPGFELITSSDRNDSNDDDKLINNIDHIAFVQHVGTSDQMMKWYQHCFHFRRALINVDDDANEGFVVKHGVKGLRLRAAISCLRNPSVRSQPNASTSDPVRFVFAESLTGQSESSQVTKFLDFHRGPGLQHIAFGTTNLISAASSFIQTGLECVKPPAKYYNQLLQIGDIDRLHYDVETLRHHNILLESHVTDDCDVTDDVLETTLELQRDRIKDTTWYILQLFTTPTVFDEETLFFEVIQRFRTQVGFGAGNILAVWKSVNSGHDNRERE